MEKIGKVEGVNLSGQRDKGSLDIDGREGVAFVSTYEEFLSRMGDLRFLKRKSGALAPRRSHTPNIYFSEQDVDGMRVLYENSSFSVIETETEKFTERSEELGTLLFNLANRLAISKYSISGESSPRINTLMLPTRRGIGGYNEENNLVKELRATFRVLLDIRSDRNRDLSGQDTEKIFFKSSSSYDDTNEYIATSGFISREKLNEFIKMAEDMIGVSQNLLSDGSVSVARKREGLNTIEESKAILERIKGLDLDSQTETTAIAVVDHRVWRHRESKEMNESNSVELSFDYSLMTKEERLALPEALQNLESLSFEKGGMTTIIGPNGSGKSVFIRALQIALQYYSHPESSHITTLIGIEDNDGSKIPRFTADLARSMDVVGMRVNDRSCILLDLARGAQNFVYLAGTRKVDTGDFLPEMFAKQKIRSKSTGQIQNEMIDDASNVYGLADYRGILILDEPEKGLDPWRLKEMKIRIRTLAPNATILIVTHNPLIVFDGETPRLDLRFPEKGVHVNEDESIF